MEKLISTYGKTIHTWHTDQNRELPLGIPMLLMGFTGDEQINPELIKERDKRFDVSTEEIKMKRVDIPSPAIIPGANALQKGEIRQFVLSDETDSAIKLHHGLTQKGQQ